MPKKLVIGTAATLGLRAELERACEESKNGELPDNPSHNKDSYIRHKTKNRKSSHWSQANKGVLERDSKANASNTRDTKNIPSSFSSADVRQRLERKAALYDTLNKPWINDPQAQHIFDDPEISKILDESPIDFISKQWAYIKQRRSRSSSESNDSSDSADETIEIVDEFGRTRKVPRRNFKGSQHNYSRYCSSYKDSGDSNNVSDTDSNTSHCGMLKTESSSRLLDNTNTDPIYDTRDCGVGFYKLSSNTTEREQQIRDLKRLHQTTIELRNSTEDIAKRYKQLLDDRRAKITASHQRFLQNQC